MPVDITMNENQMQDFVLNPTKKNGQPASIQSGSLTFTTQSGSAVGEVQDDSHVRIRAMGVPGPSSVLLSADSDLGEGVVTISEIFTVNATALLAENLGVAPVSGPVDDPGL